MQTNIIRIVKFFPPEAEERHFVKWAIEQLRLHNIKSAYIIEFDVGKINCGPNGSNKCVIAKITLINKTP